MIEIKNRWDDSVIIHKSEKETVREAVEEAIAAKVDLSYANLRFANLRFANLSDANLSDANLSYANLSEANLSEANLSEANLSEANLSYANLSEANLSEANLSEANLSEANLSEANLSEANLSYANLSEANLSEANLSEANLRSANLSYANLSEANLAQFKNDLFEVLLNAPTEVETLKQKLIAGEIDGSCYESQCGMACLVGTIAIAKDCHYEGIEGITPDASRPAESWFYNINPGCTPDKNAVAAITLEWIEEFQQKMARAVAALSAKPAPVDDFECEYCGEFFDLNESLSSDKRYGYPQKFCRDCFVKVENEQ